LKKNTECVKKFKRKFTILRNLRSIKK